MTAGTVEVVHRLAMGIEPIDPIRGQRPAHPIRVDVDGQLPWTPNLTRHVRRPYRQPTLPGSLRPVLARHDSCRHVLLYPPAPAELKGTIDLRLYDHHRRVVPRRLRVPLQSAQSIMTTENAGGSVSISTRMLQPALFPGAAFDTGNLCTGLRGRVVRHGKPMRWTRVEARLPNNDPNASSVTVGRAHGDDRGEFLLTLAPVAGTTELQNPIQIDVVAFGPGQPPVPSSPELPELDAWWDLPVEPIADISTATPVASGAKLPPAYVEGARAAIEFKVGRVVSAADGITDFQFSPV